MRREIQIEFKKECFNKFSLKLWLVRSYLRFDEQIMDKFKLVLCNTDSSNCANLFSTAHLNEYLKIKYNN